MPMSLELAEWAAAYKAVWNRWWEAGWVCTQASEALKQVKEGKKLYTQESVQKAQEQYTNSQAVMKEMRLEMEKLQRVKPR